MKVQIRRFARSDGLELVGDEAGPPDAPTVVLLHGGGQTRYSWRSELERLANEGYHIIAYDARGHGDSDWASDGDYSIGALTADLRAVLDSLTGPIVLVGASMGGLTSFYLIGCDQPSAVKALVLVDIVPRPAPAGARKILDFMSAHRDGFVTVEEAADAVAAYNPERPRPRDPSGLWNNLRRRADDRLYWHWDPALLGTAEAAEAPAFTDDALAVAASVTLPTLLVRGGRSDVVDDAGVAELREIVPQTEVFDVPTAGHMVAGDDNGTFHAGIAKFLRRHLPLSSDEATVFAIHEEGDENSQPA